MADTAADATVEELTALHATFHSEDEWAISRQTVHQAVAPGTKTFRLVITALGLLLVSLVFLSATLPGLKTGDATYLESLIALGEDSEEDLDQIDFDGAQLNDFFNQVSKLHRKEREDELEYEVKSTEAFLAEINGTLHFEGTADNSRQGGLAELHIDPYDESQVPSESSLEGQVRNFALNHKKTLHKTYDTVDMQWPLSCDLATETGEDGIDRKAEHCHLSRDAPIAFNFHLVVEYELRENLPAESIVEDEKTLPVVIYDKTGGAYALNCNKTKAACAVPFAHGGRRLFAFRHYVCKPACKWAQKKVCGWSKKYGRWQHACNLVWERVCENVCAAAAMAGGPITEAIGLSVGIVKGAIQLIKNPKKFFKNLGKGFKKLGKQIKKSLPSIR